ncbi:MAG: hypothetical protein ACK559_33475, partial [bacterium]
AGLGLRQRLRADRPRRPRRRRAAGLRPGGRGLRLHRRPAHRGAGLAAGAAQRRRLCGDPMRSIPMRIIALSGALLGGCDPIEPMPSDLPCREAGYAIAARTTQCTGDAALGQARYE